MASSSAGSAFEALVEPLRQSPGRVRFTVLDPENGVSTLRGQTILDRAEAMSRWLAAGDRREVSPRPALQTGDRVLLAYPSGVDFVVAFLAVVRAGGIPVPVSSPKPSRRDTRYAAVAEDSGATIGLTDSATRDRLATAGDTSLLWLSEPGGSDTPSPQSEDPASPQGSRDGPLFLQYTSGSTSRPKGVMVTLENLLANLEVIRRGFRLDHLPTADRIVCSWLPNFHDMGLVGVLLSTLVHDGHAILLPPASFIQRPSRWLEAIHTHRAAVTVAPTIGYRMATQKISDDSAAGWDLRCLKVAACGAEPIEADVMKSFAERFASRGLDPRSIYPCYGLAESTLMVTGAATRQPDRSPTSANGSVDHSETLPLRINAAAEEAAGFGDDSSRFTHGLPRLEDGAIGLCTLDVDRPALGEGRVTDPMDDSRSIELVSSGVPGWRTEVKIVDATTRTPCESDQTGEIWVHGKSVAAGYWNDPDMTEQTFHARIASLDGGVPGSSLATKTYLRTGDIGFLHDGELFVTGRLKDLIIVRGQNHIPQDIERTVRDVLSESLADAPIAAFPVSTESGEALVVAIEANRGMSPDDVDPLLDEVRVTVASTHDVLPHEVLLLRTASMPRTSSGKIRRQECRQRYQENGLRIVARRSAATRLDPDIFRDLAPMLSSHDPMTSVREAIERTLVTWLRRQTGGDAASIHARRPFAECGIDSLMAVEMSDQMQRWLGIELSPVIAWSHPNAAEMADYLARQVVQQASDEAPAESSDLESLLAEIESMDDDEVQRELDRDGRPAG